jgi:hypothetical protein
MMIRAIRLISVIIMSVIVIVIVIVFDLFAAGAADRGGGPGGGWQTYRYSGKHITRGTSNAESALCQTEKYRVEDRRCGTCGAQRRRCDPATWRGDQAESQTECGCS